jgi:hypothetical protein
MLFQFDVYTKLIVLLLIITKDSRKVHLQYFCIKL